MHLELGGKSALIVLDDVDVEKAVSVGAFGSFLHQGQCAWRPGATSCSDRSPTTTSASLAEHADRLPVGNPATEQVALGPIIDAGQRDRIHGLVTELGRRGRAARRRRQVRGPLLPPDGARRRAAEAPAFTEEIFGPVAPVVAFDTLDEAVELARDTRVRPLARHPVARRDEGVALADRIPSGIVHINDQTIMDEVVNPFGGVKSSGGGGRLGGPLANFEAFTEVQWVTLRSDLPAYPF